MVVGGVGGGGQDNVKQTLRAISAKMLANGAKRPNTKHACTTDNKKDSLSPNDCKNVVDTAPT